MPLLCCECFSGCRLKRREFFICQVADVILLKVIFRACFSHFSCVQRFATLWADCSLSGSSVHGILQARILDWVAVSPPGDLSDPGVQPESPASPAFFTH